MIGDLFRKFIEKLLSVSIFVKILGIPLSMVLLLAAGTIFTTNKILHSTLVKQLDADALRAAEGVSSELAELMAVNDEFSIHRLLNDLLKNNKDIVYALVSGRDGSLLYSTVEGGVTGEFLSVHKANNTAASIEHLVTESGYVRDIAVPVLGGSLGTFRAGFSEKRIRREIEQRTWQLITLISGISLIGFVISYMITNILYRPITSLTSAVARVGHGDFTVRLKPQMVDEIGQLTIAFNKMAENLYNANRNLRSKERVRLQLMKKIITSQEEERVRISRDLHDKAGQLLTSMKVGLKSIETASESAALKRKLERFRLLLNDSLEELHTLSVELRPPLLQDFGLFKAVKKYAEDFEKNHGIKVSYRVAFRGECRLSYPVEIGIYRVIQEAFTNTAKHAKADAVKLSFEKSGRRLVMHYSDNGAGFTRERLFQDTGRKTLGVMGMEERLHVIGGNFSINSAPGKGTQICAKIPLSK